MQNQSRRRWWLILASALAPLVVLAVLWAAAPEDVRGPLLLVGGVLAVVVYVALFAIQRREHWGS